MSEQKRYITDTEISIFLDNNTYSIKIEGVTRAYSPRQALTRILRKQANDAGFMTVGNKRVPWKVVYRAIEDAVYKQYNGNFDELFKNCRYNSEIKVDKSQGSEMQKIKKTGVIGKQLDLFDGMDI